MNPAWTWLLAIETSDRPGSVALARFTPPAGSTEPGRAPEIVAERGLDTGRRAAADLAPAIASLLDTAGLRPVELGAVGFAQGPGSFTGLRLAATVARMFAETAGSQVVGVPTGQVVAVRATESQTVPVQIDSGDASTREPSRVGVVLEGKRGQAFCGLFDTSAEPIELVPMALRNVRDWIAESPRPLILTGQGCAQLDASETASWGAKVRIVDPALWRPAAADVARLACRRAARGEWLAREAILPDYRRAAECEEVYEQRRAAAIARRSQT